MPKLCSVPSPPTNAMALRSRKGEAMEDEMIYGYSRKQAIEDGVLIDVSERAKEAGFRIPVAVTSGAWGEIVVPDLHDREAGQSEQGRLWDVLNVLRWTIRQSHDGEDTIHFEVLVWRAGRTTREKLKAVCGPGDNAEPVITVMLPHED